MTNWLTNFKSLSEWNSFLMTLEGKTTCQIKFNRNVNVSCAKQLQKEMKCYMY